MDLKTVEHVNFAVLASDYRSRAIAPGLPAHIAQDYVWIAEHLERAAVLPMLDLHPFHMELVAGGQPVRGGFSRGRAAEIIDQYLDEVEALNGRSPRVNHTDGEVQHG